MKALLIPSAVLVPHDMRNKFGELPTALFPLGNKTMIERIYDQYKNIVDKIYVVVFKKKLLIKDYIALKKLPIEVIELDELKDLGYTIQYGLENILTKEPLVDYIYINFADSLIDESLLNNGSDIFYYTSQMRPKEWSYFPDEWTYFKEKNGQILNILDKGNNLNTVSQNDFKDIFVGVFGISKPFEFIKSFSFSNELINNIDTFYQALLSYSNKISFISIETKEWFDVGHSENYSKATTSVAARSFNSIEIDERRGILHKKSENKEKLVDEIRWYLRLPNKVQYLLPRIYDYSLDLNEPYVSMEYYGYHTLHESLVYGDLPLVKWQDIFDKLLFAIKDMENFKVNGDLGRLCNDLRAIYLNKTFQRLDLIKKDKEFQIFFEKPIIINGEVYRSLNEYINLLPSLIERLLIDTFDGQFNIIHGDLCFANILIEDTYDFIRVIDPRGKFGTYDIYGDPRYELAKLMHTLEGKYDFIIEDLFAIRVSNNSIDYDINKTCDNVLNVFLDVFADKLSNLNAIRLIESTLFLSMIPLHSDYRTRQFAMLATGIKLLEQVIKDSER